MNKTILRNIHLVNWYGFSNRTIPVSENLTLISGENECGKSTILDAVKYAYTGDTQFNKATSGYNTGVGKRNLVSYTRCLVDASSGIYARPADKIPVVYTHIALEYFDQINESSFVLGVVIETAVTDIRGTYWYAMDGKTIADMAYEYVVALKDENWRNAIETFLGVHRYAIIVSKDAFDIANAVLDRSRYRYVELVNTKRLMSKKLECKEDSVFLYLDIQNETAANYFKFWLGSIHAVDIEKVPDYDNAMSMEGKLSRNMAVTYINTRKIRSYCLGSQAIELNRRAAEKRLIELEKKEQDILLEQRSLQDKSKYLQDGLECFKEFNLNVHKEWADVSVNLNNERGHYKELLEAQKNNAEFMTLNERVFVLENQLNIKKNDRKKNIDQKTILEARISENEKSIKKSKEQEKLKQAELDKERIVSNSAVEKAIEEYDQYLSGENQNGALMVRATKERVDRRVRELEGNINGNSDTIYADTFSSIVDVV